MGALRANAKSTKGIGYKGEETGARDHVLKEELLFKITHAVMTDLGALGENIGSVNTANNFILSLYLSAPTATLDTTTAKATAIITAQPEVVVIETDGVPITTK